MYLLALKLKVIIYQLFDFILITMWPAALFIYDDFKYEATNKNIFIDLMIQLPLYTDIMFDKKEYCKMLF